MLPTDDRCDMPVTRTTLPPPPEPAGAYRAVVARGGLGFVSGQFPLAAGKMLAARTDGAAADVDALRPAARLAALNVVAQIHAFLGSWDGFGGLCRVDGIVRAPECFTDHAVVLDAASETFVQLFGPRLGAHARSAMSSTSLPRDAAVELVVTFALTAEAGRRPPG